MSYPKVSGSKFLAAEANSAYNSVALYSQSIDGTVSTGDLVYFDGTDWQTATTQNAAGIYDGTNVVVHGYVAGLTDLTVGEWYGKDSSGNLVANFTTTEQCIGYALSTTELVILLGGLNSYTGKMGVFGGGYNGSGAVDTLQYIYIASAGNTTDFGDLTVGRYNIGACSSSTRGVWAGGGGGDVIDYIEFNTLGNATDFGNLTAAINGPVGLSNSTRGVFQTNPGPASELEYITIASTGNATSFGNSTYYSTAERGAFSSPTRGIYGGGYSGTFSDIIDYITIANTGNATDFGDLTVARCYLSGCSSPTRGLFMGGNATPESDVIDYITIASTGNATDFGNLTTGTDYGATCSSHIRGIWAGGGVSALTNVIEYVTIASTGNATDFGDLLVAIQQFSGCSNAHGGLT